MNSTTGAENRGSASHSTAAQQAKMAFFGLGPTDLQPLRSAQEIILRNVDGLVRGFYNFVLAFPELERFVQSQNVRARLEQSFRQYLLTLGVEIDTPEYAEGRLRIGAVHEKIGLPISGYLGAYSHLQAMITRMIVQQRESSADALAAVSAINKVIMLDASFAVDAYHRAAMSRIEQLMRQLEEDKEEIRHLAEMDHLTGLFNRRYMYDRLESEIQRCQRYGNSLCLLSLDLDNFKSINDTHGHHAGDAVLRTFGAVLKRCVRKTDSCGRLGGEEFGVILVETEPETARLMAERIRLAILNEDFNCGRFRLSVSASIGIAPWQADVAGASELLKRADAGVYAAKAAGKNCICVADERCAFPIDAQCIEQPWQAQPAGSL